MYPAASNPDIPMRDNQSIIGSIVLFLRVSNHDTSLSDNDPAVRIVGRFAGHSTMAGAYPPDGEFGRALLA